MLLFGGSASYDLESGGFSFRNGRVSAASACQTWMNRVIFVPSLTTKSTSPLLIS
jgi:hypothetical protein